MVLSSVCGNGATAGKSMDGDQVRGASRSPNQSSRLRQGSDSPYHDPPEPGRTSETLPKTKVPVGAIVLVHVGMVPPLVLVVFPEEDRRHVGMASRRELLERRTSSGEERSSTSILCMKNPKRGADSAAQEGTAHAQ